MTMSGAVTAPAAAVRLRPEVIEANLALDKAFCAAMSNKDLDGVMSCLWDSPDLVVVLYGKVLRGSEQARHEVNAMVETMRALTLEINEVQYVACGDDVIAVGTATYHFYPRLGAPSELVERWTDVRRCIEGRWYYVLDHAEEIG
jgi:ketosteroid isomerase-like protein